MTSTPGRLDSRQLAAMYHELDRDKVRSAHASSTGEPDVGLIAKMDALSAEMKMRQISLRTAAKLLGKRSYEARLKQLGIERIREIARQNGKLGGRPRKEGVT